MIAESFLDVIGTPNFFDFHIPVIVSITIAKPIKNKIPVIGRKKVDITANMYAAYFMIYKSLLLFSPAVGSLNT